VGGTAGAAASGGAAGSGGALCVQIAQGFQDALFAAKSCTPGAPNACDDPIDSSLEACGYYVFADSSKTQALEDLEQLRDDFKNQGCDDPGTCAVGGWGPVATTCVPAGSGGTTGTCTPD
jgi:hypothetical protein